MVYDQRVMFENYNVMLYQNCEQNWKES